jgi:hypothetical protein
MHATFIINIMDERNIILCAVLIINAKLHIKHESKQNEQISKKKSWWKEKKVYKNKMCVCMK